jgi:hypothetical protein
MKARNEPLPSEGIVDNFLSHRIRQNQAMNCSKPLRNNPDITWQQEEEPFPEGSKKKPS